MTTSPLPDQLLPEQHKNRLLSEPRGPAAPGSSVAWHQQFPRLHIVRSLEAVQDMIIVSLCVGIIVSLCVGIIVSLCVGIIVSLCVGIIVSLCVGLFCIMALQLKEIFASLLNKPQFHAITADILFILILVELFRLLIIYLQEQRVSIGVSVEIAIVSVLREVIVSGVLATDWHQVLAVCLFLATAALLLVVRVWLPPTFAGVDPEARVSARIRSSQDND